MPTPDQILAGLYTIANQARPVSIGWHVLALAVALGVAVGFRHSRRAIAVALVCPAVSVAVLAWTYGNPFNGLMFTALSVTLGLIALRLPVVAIERPPRWCLFFGLAMGAFGLVYPHFLDAGDWVTYLYAAPTGLVPCPTLSLIIGVTLVVDGLRSRAWSFVLVAFGMFYALFGTLRLGVYLDAGLLMGTVALLVHSLIRPPSTLCYGAAP